LIEVWLVTDRIGSILQFHDGKIDSCGGFGIGQSGSDINISRMPVVAGSP
jgi:hypothetical protein